MEDGRGEREDSAPSRRDVSGLPIMHWEALSLRIAELEKQEEEKKDKLAKSASASLDRGRAPVGSAGGRRDSREDTRRRHRYRREDDDDDGGGGDHVSALGSRMQTQMNLQLCFINNSESDEEEEEEEEPDAAAAAAAVPGASAVTGRQTPAPAHKSEKSKSGGFRNTWRRLRQRLRADNKAAAAAANPTGADRTDLAGRWRRGDVRELTLVELRARRSFLAQTVQELSSDLVAGLQVRDQLRTEQDAMLLELQDLTSPGSPLGAAVGTV
ncbi:schwannomin-interacting protein 1 [Syngnathoides biaculeatus]|uniref:schwannomin-interacting protein 1 n=1 Tax=Syngnathoides biaculeatus TaxID=300417 RepID=UPI002ADE165A|nr:schwannomin-interacting protein 1 [Syngnathoides biaculeatus]